MKKLLNFLFTYRTLALFIFLQSICLWLIVSRDRFYNASFFNSSNALSGSLNHSVTNTTDYFSLRQINDQLSEENALLRQQLANTLYHQLHTDSFPGTFKVIPGKIVNKTFQKSANYLTLNLGQRDGITKEMGVITEKAVVGKVQAVSNHYATVVSILNPGVMISSQVKRTGTLCTAQWDTNDPFRTSVKYIPRHVLLLKGDTIQTSGYNAIFPPGIMVGVVDSVYLSKEAPFYYATVDLSVDFSSLSYAYAVINETKSEKDSLESILIEEL